MSSGCRWAASCYRNHWAGGCVLLRLIVHFSTCCGLRKGPMIVINEGRRTDATNKFGSTGISVNYSFVKLQKSRGFHSVTASAYANIRKKGTQVDVQWHKFVLCRYQPIVLYITHKLAYVRNQLGGCVTYEQLTSNISILYPTCPQSILIYSTFSWWL